MLEEEEEEEEEGVVIEVEVGGGWLGGRALVVSGVVCSSIYKRKQDSTNTFVNSLVALAFSLLHFLF